MRRELNPEIPAEAGRPPPYHGPMSAQASDISRRFIATGAVQIVIGVLCIILNIITLAIAVDAMRITGHGLWCGVLFIVTGGFGIGAGKYRSRCQIIAYMVLCIISLLLAILALLGIGIFAAILLAPRKENNYCHGYCLGYRPEGNEGLYNASFAMEILLIISGLIEFSVAIYGAVICCKSGKNCCCDCCNRCNYCTSEPLTFVSAVHVPNNGQMFRINQTQAGQCVYSPHAQNNGQMFHIDLPRAEQYVYSPQPIRVANLSGSMVSPPPYVSNWQLHTNWMVGSCPTG